MTIPQFGGVFALAGHRNVANRFAKAMEKEGEPAAVVSLSVNHPYREHWGHLAVTGEDIAIFKDGIAMAQSHPDPKRVAAAQRTLLRRLIEAGILQEEALSPKDLAAIYQKGAGKFQGRVDNLLDKIFQPDYEPLFDLEKPGIFTMVQAPRPRPNL